MEHTLSLSKEQQSILDQVQTAGSGAINTPEQIDLLIQGILNAAGHTYNAVMDAVKEDRALCKTISKRMCDLADSIVEGNNSAVQSVIDTCKANCDAIRQFINNPDSSDATISECFSQLRYYFDCMRELQQKTESNNQEIANRAANVNEVVLDRSKKNRDLAVGLGIGAGGAALLYGFVKLIKELKKK